MLDTPGHVDYRRLHGKDGKDEPHHRQSRCYCSMLQMVPVTLFRPFYPCSCRNRGGACLSRLGKMTDSSLDSSPFATSINVLPFPMNPLL
jgi:hypothetical protein